MVTALSRASFKVLSFVEDSGEEMLVFSVAFGDLPIFGSALLTPCSARAGTGNSGSATGDIETAVVITERQHTATDHTK
jgi:hypothetical protein